MVVFTDREADAKRLAQECERASITVVKTDTLGWPDATLLRYRLIASARYTVEGEVVMHLDADMRVVAPVGPELTPWSWHGGIALVRHPGFYRGNRYSAFVTRHPRLAVTDLKGWLLRERGVGQWETREESRAYVPPQRRQEYVCGGVWFGRTAEFLSMVDTLARRTDADLRDGVVARWHDESHLNWFAAHHEVSVLSPSYCYGQGLASLRGVVPKIVALEKGDVRVR